MNFFFSSPILARINLSMHILFLFRASIDSVLKESSPNLIILVDILFKLLSNLIALFFLAASLAEGRFFQI